MASSVRLLHFPDRRLSVITITTCFASSAVRRPIPSNLSAEPLRLLCLPGDTPPRVFHRSRSRLLPSPLASDHCSFELLCRQPASPPAVTGSSTTSSAGAMGLFSCCGRQKTTDGVRRQAHARAHRHVRDRPRLSLGPLRHTVSSTQRWSHNGERSTKSRPGAQKEAQSRSSLDS
jgi:hypothetical protein